MWRQVRRRGTEETIRSRIHPRFPPTFPHTESRRTRGGTDRFRTKAAKARAVFASSFSRFSPGRPLRTPKRTRDLEVSTASRASSAKNAGHGVYGYFDEAGNSSRSHEEVHRREQGCRRRAFLAGAMRSVLAVVYTPYHLTMERDGRHEPSEPVQRSTKVPRD